jgi:hypothetical protein
LRAPAEIAFRLRQEVRNLWLLAAPPKPAGGPEPRMPGWPGPEPVVEALRGTAFAREVEEIAGRVVSHETPLFGAAVRYGDPIRWRRDPVRGIETGLDYFRSIPYLDVERAGDHKTIWELNRHQHLVLLCQAYRMSGHPEIVREVWRQLESWLEQNPFQRGINWASALEVGFRALSWIWIHHLCGHEMPGGLRARFLTALFQHGCHLETNLSFYFSRNTHLLGEALALHALGLLFRMERWVNTGNETMVGELGRQVLPDGAYFELSSYYHVYALDMYLLHYLLAGCPAAFEPLLARMADHLDALLGPDRRMPSIGDDDGGRLFHPYGERAEFGRATLATCGVLLGGGRWRFEPEDLWPQAVWWMGPEVLTKWGRPPACGGLSGRQSGGLAFLRSGSADVIFDAGTLGSGRGGHSHSDALNLIVRRGSDEILVDAGTYTYVSDAAGRDWFRGSAAHNTIRVDGRDQAEPDGPFGWRGRPRVVLRRFEPGDRLDLVEAEWRYGGIGHRRRVVFLKPSLIYVRDEVTGEGEHEVEQFWHFGLPVEAAGGGRFAIGGVACLTVAPGWEMRLERGGEHGWRSTVFGRREEAAVVIARRRGRLPMQGGAVLRV